MKTLIMIIGAGATGKSTLSRTLAGVGAVEEYVHLKVTEKGKPKQVASPYVLGSQIAVAGNLKNSSDAIGTMDALYQTIDHCWRQRDVVVVDPFRCTNKLVRWIEEHPLKPAALFVYIELSLDSNLARLRGRRSGNGRVEHKLPRKTFLNVLTFRERARGVWNYAQDHYSRQPVRYAELPEGMKPEESAQLVEAELKELRKSPGQIEIVPKASVSKVVDSIFKTQSFDRDLVRWEDQLLDLTPVESIGGIWWKREDKFAPLGYGGINGSKLRQLIWLFSQNLYIGAVSGAVTGSPQLPMVAACAKHWNIPCVQVIGGKPESALKYEMVKMAVELGARSVFSNPGYAATLNAMARAMCGDGLSGYLHVETNITVEHKINPPERIEAFHRVGSEQCRNIPPHIETLLIPAGSCNSLTSILYGLGRFKPKSLKTIHLFRIMNNDDKNRHLNNQRLDIIREVKGDPLPLPYKFVEHNLVEGNKPYTSYNELRPYRHKELDFHPRYEGKCLNYMKDNLSTFRPLLNDKSLFWIIGSKPQ